MTPNAEKHDVTDSRHIKFYNKTRLRIVLFVGLLFWALILHDVFSFRLRVTLEYESLGYLLNRVPGGWLSISAAGAAVALLMLLACWLPGISFSANLSLLVSVKGAAFVLAGCSFLWLQPDHPLPQEWSGVLSVLVGFSLLLFAFIASKRVLLVTHVAFLSAALAVALATLFGPAHRAKERGLRTALEKALVDLETRRQTWGDANPSKPLHDARDIANRFEVYRFDEHLDAVKELVAERAHVAERTLLEFPRDGKFIPLSEDVPFVTSEAKQVFPNYRGESLLRTEAPLGLESSDIGSIQLRMTVSKGTYFQLFWSEDEGMGRSDRIRMPLGTPGKTMTYEIKERIIRHRGKGTINQFWLVPSDEDASVVIQSFRVLDRVGGALGGLPYQTGYENVDQETRRVLFASAPSRITYEVAVPSVRPRLQFGVNAPDETVPVTFEIAMRADGKDTAIFSQQVPPTSKWHDYQVDLEPWAGRTVNLTFKTEAQKEALGIWSNPVLRGQRPPLPNVVVFLVDSLRADHLGAYGYARDTSPTFDALTRSGVLFERAFSNGTMTKHTIPGLFSSNPISATGVRHGADVLPEAFPTLAEILRSMGYVTAAFTTNGNAGPYSGTHQGFSVLFDGHRIAQRAVRAEMAPNAGMVVGDLLRDWIHENADTNFFLYVHTMDPHGPYDPPAGYRHFGDGIPNGTPVTHTPYFDPPWLSSSSRESRIALYDGEIAFGDLHLGRFLQLLEETGVRDNTLLVFTADHGEYLGEHGMWGHGPPPFVQGTHIPLLLAGGGVPSGVRVGEIVQQLDILPTVLEAVGIVPDRTLFQGESLWARAHGQPSSAFTDRLVFVEASSPGEVSFHCGSVHFIPKKNMIFDLSEDSEEDSYLNEFALDFGLKSLARRVAVEYVRTYQSFHNLIVTSPGDAAQVDPLTLEQLREMGYIQ